MRIIYMYVCMYVSIRRCLLTLLKNNWKTDLLNGPDPHHQCNIV